jgi:hypothetical protein
LEHFFLIIFSYYLCDECKEKSSLIKVKENGVDLDESISELICRKCFNEISAELIRRKISLLNIPDTSNDEKLPNVERLERYCPPDWNFLWGRA